MGAQRGIFLTGIISMVRFGLEDSELFKELDFLNFDEQLHKISEEVSLLKLLTQSGELMGYIKTNHSRWRNLRKGIMFLHCITQ